MPYNAQVLSVFIATPGDVAAERRIIRDVIDEWNVANARHRGIVLMAEGWETHSTPKMGDRGQAIINKQLLEHADLLVGVFWTRVGTSTGDYVSGTVEEIERHIAAGKPAMIYFSATPIEPDSVDPGQYKAVKEFRASLQKRGLYAAFESRDQFEELFRRHLAQTMNDQFAQLTRPAGTTEPKTGVQLSPQAQQLLAEGAKSSDGMILAINLNGSLAIQVNDKPLLEPGNPREEARWRAAIEELEGYDLIRDAGEEGEVLELTNAGYEMAEQLAIAPRDPNGETQ